MSEGKHTPATWYEASDRIRDEASDAIVATIEDGGHVENEIFNSAARKKHARLIAAAPELLDALRSLSNVIANMRVPQNTAEAGVQVMLTIGPALEVARHAIAKAEGIAS